MYRQTVALWVTTAYSLRIGRSTLRCCRFESSCETRTRSSHDTLNTRILFMYQLWTNRKSHHLHYYSFIIHFSTNINTKRSTSATHTHREIENTYLYQPEFFFFFVFYTVQCNSSEDALNIEYDVLAQLDFKIAPDNWTGNNLCKCVEYRVCWRRRKKSHPMI